jgi:hypothetical protein
MLLSGPIVDVQSAKIDLLEPFFYVPALYSESSPIHLRQCASVHRAGVTWCHLSLRCSEHGNSRNVVLHCCRGLISNATAPLYGRLYLNPIPRDNALRCWHQNRIKGSCANTLFLAPSASPATMVLFSSKPSTISIKHAMSTASLPPKTSHRSSADSAKVMDAIPAPVGQPSAEIYDQDDDYYPPNNWARIRLATNIIYYSP